jgi:RHS repeat-associated protein
MKKIFYLITLLISNILVESLFSETQAFFDDVNDKTYIFDTANVITGEYTEAQNDLHLNGPEPFVLRRYHTRNDRFLYGWHCNLPNLINAPMPGNAGHWTNLQKISYEYDQKNRLKSVKNSDPSDQYVYSWMNVQYSESPSQCFIQTHDGQQITYRFLDHYLLSEVLSSHQPSISYKYQKHPLGEGFVISRREHPDGRFVENEYYEKNHPHAGKIKLQKRPVGYDSTPIITHRFIYHEGYTEVYDALNAKTIYRFANGSLTAVEEYDAQGILCRAENLIWKNAGPQQPNQLKTRYIKDENGAIIIARTLSYDAKGHLIRETMHGNLSGLCTTPIVLDEEGVPLKNGVESYSIYHEYSNDLLTSTSEDNGKKTLYHYNPKNSQRSAKLTCVEGKILLRECYFYNAYGQMIKVCEDNGSSENPDNLLNVTQRHIKNISYRQQHPGLGLPEISEEACQDLASNQEILLKKIVNHYDDKAQVVQQDIYDAEGNYQYSIYNRYDERGRLTSTTDANGCTVESSYDLNNNLLKTFSLDTKGHFQEATHNYDYSNRLISRETLDNDQIPRKVHYQYDLKGHKTACIDECGNITHYEYDPLGREIKVILPPVFDENLNIVNPTIKKKYDAQNHIIEQTDAKGLTTRTEYNARGNPTAIYYPHSTEKFVYNLDGSLKFSFQQPGLKTVFHRDALGRILKVETFHNEKLFKESTFKYDAFHLLSVQESSGLNICYQYDPAGRLLSMEQKKDHLIIKRITYEYNSLGRETLSKEWFGRNLADYIVTIKDYDAGHDLKSTRVESSDGKIQKFIQHKTEKSSNRTTYEDYGLNSLGQQILRKTEADAEGNLTVTEFDALKRPVKMTKRNVYGEIIAQQEMRWNVNGKKARETYYLNANESVSTVWSYDSMDRVSEMTEGVGTPHPKHTKYAYDEEGKLKTILKPDGVQIHYQYDDLGNISRLSSSDSTVDYSFTYDSRKNIVGIFDAINNMQTTRTFCSEGSLLEERQGNGLCTSRQYDELNRCVNLTLSDDSSIQYVYEGVYLREVRRENPQGTAYAHIYKERDDRGRIQVEDLAAQAGIQKRTYDSDGHLTAIEAPHWSENIGYSTFNPQAIVGINIKDASGMKQNEFVYDPQERLTQESGLFNHAFAYDWSGNQISKKQSNSGFADQVSQDCYDLNGNLKEKQLNGKISFEYDALNRLIAAHHENGQTYQYTYDAFHRRLSKLCFGSNGEKLWEEKYLYDKFNEIGAVNEEGQISQLRILGEGLGGEIGSAVAMELDGKVFIPIHDHRGSVCCLIDSENQAPAENIHYSAFGEEAGENSEAICPWRFSSKRYDPETGLVYFGKRYYDPAASRWITEDPLGTIEGANLYAFASNNPLSRIDPYGLFSFATFWQDLFDEIISIGNKIAHFFHSITDFIHEHLSLEANFKETIEEGAIAVFGKGSLNLYGFYLDREEVGTFGQGEMNDKVRITLINGILNARHDLSDTLDMITNLHGGNNIHFIFRPTEGWTLDVIKGALVKFGWISPQAKQLAERWKELITDMGGIQGGGKIIHYAHSIGAVDTFAAAAFLSPEELSMIQVYTFGSPALLSHSGFQSVTNYVSKGDGVSLLDPIRYFQHLFDPQDHISLLPSSWSIPFIDHPLTFPTYQTVLETLGKQFIDLYSPS